jgi:hypothetical protein
MLLLLGGLYHINWPSFWGSGQLNRARTRNRKAAYIIINFDYKRLCAEGVTTQSSLNEVRRLPFLPWETALHILDRTNLAASRRGHLAPTLRYMAFCYFIIELLCVFLAIYLSWPLISYSSIILILIVVFLVIALDIYRLRVLKALKGRISVQGYVEQWLALKFDNKLEMAPQYLQEWVHEYNAKKPRPTPHP